MTKRNLQDTLKHFEENSGGGSEFFSLKNDKDTAVVRFLHEGEDDLDWYVVHEAQINGKKRWVQCLEDETCPMCASGNKTQLKLFLQMVDKRDGKVKLWERGQKFIPKIISLINRYGNLVGREFEIERSGKAGSKDTQYLIYPLDEDGKVLADFPKRQELLAENGFILQKSVDEMVAINNGTYTPPTSSNNNQQQSQQTNYTPPTRRERGNSDVF